MTTTTEGSPHASRLRVLRRLPFTTLMILAVLAVSTVAGLLSHPISEAQLDRYGFGLTDLRDGALWRLLTAPFLILKPYMALTIAAILLFFVGTCELVLRTRRTLIVFGLAHATGYIGALLLLSGLGRAGVEAAARLASHRDVGASNGAFGAAGALLVFLPPSMRNTGLVLIGGYLLGALVVEQQIWDVQHSLAFATGALLGALFLRRDRGLRPGLSPTVTVLHRQRARLMAWMVGGMGTVNVLAAILLPHHPGFLRLEALLPLGLAGAPRYLLLGSGLLLLVLGGGLGRGQTRAWWGAFVTLLATLVLQLELGITKIEALFALVFLMLMAAWKEEFRASAAGAARRVRARTLLGLVVAVPVAAWVSVLALRKNFDAFPGVLASMEDVLRRLFFLTPERLTPAERQVDWLLDAIPLVFWIGLLLLALRALRSARAPAARPMEKDLVRELVLEYGRTSTAFMGTWPGNAHFFGPGDGCVISYRVQLGVAVMLGDPVGYPSLRAATLEAFGHFCLQQGWTPAALAASAPARPLYADAGYQLLQIGEEAVLPLEGLEFKGKHWGNMRTAINRAEREGVRFLLLEGGRVPPELEAQLFEISRAWQSSQRLPAMEFTLGRTEDVRDPAVEVALAVDAGGRVQAFVDWLPLPAERGWVIDLMRRRPDCMSGSMEYVIGMSLLAFQQRGDRTASLATAPLADLDREDERSLLPQVLGAIFTSFETYYDFKSLFDFKDRFKPRWEPVYLAYRDPAELPAVAAAILRAHLPQLHWVDAVRLFGQVVAEKLRPATVPDGSPRG